MNKKKLLITGGTGCIGASILCELTKHPEIDEILIATRSEKNQPVKLWLGKEVDPRMKYIQMDLSNYDAIRTVLPELNPTHIIHLGGFQSPECSQYHLKGMEINVGGTMLLFDTAEKLSNLERFVFASSGAVYGRRAQYAEKVITEEALLSPPNHYGIWKVAGEYLARLFQERTGVPTICLRLNTTYGPGRDRGTTSAPTCAMKSITLGASKNELVPFVMPYRGLENYHYVEDVAAHFIASTLRPFEGYGVYNVKGRTIEVETFLQIVREQAEKLDFNEFIDISFAENAPPNPFIYDLCADKIDAVFPGLPLTEVPVGVKKSLTAFRLMAEGQKLTHALYLL